jgi:hypothetical protein
MIMIIIMTPQKLPSSPGCASNFRIIIIIMIPPKIVLFQAVNDPQNNVIVVIIMMNPFKTPLFPRL